MNAPVDVTSLQAAFEYLPLTTICPSETRAQARRRKRYTEEAIAGLAASMGGGIGVIEPVVVRKLKAMRGLAVYELVAGEQRWLAAEKAGLAHIPAMVREIADADLVAFQLIENLQRQSVHPLEEAEDYRDLMQDKKLDAEAVGELVGVSRSQVYARLRLLSLKHPAALDALEAGRIDHSKALLIARIPTMKLQLKALEIVADDSVSVREAAALLRDKLMVRLDGVPFQLTDATFETQKAEQFDCQQGRGYQIPACTECRNCSLYDQEFQLEVEAAYGDSARVCTDKPCHDHKVKMFFARRVEEARGSGLTVIEGDEAKLVKPYSHTEDLHGYIDLDAECEEPVPAGLLQEIQGPGTDRNPTYREVLGKQAAASAVLIDPHNHQPRQLMTSKEAAKALKKKGVDLAQRAQLHPRSDLPPEKTGLAPTVDHEERKREQEKEAARQEQERAYRRRLLALVHEKWKGPLKRDELQAICDHIMQQGDWPEFVDELHGTKESGGLTTARMKEHELARLLFEMTIGLCVDYLNDSPNLLIATAKRFKIDPAKVRKKVKAELGGDSDETEKKANRKKTKRSKK